MRLYSSFGFGVIFRPDNPARKSAKPYRTVGSSVRRFKHATSSDLHDALGKLSEIALRENLPAPLTNEQFKHLKAFANFAPNERTYLLENVLNRLVTVHGLSHIDAFIHYKHVMRKYEWMRLHPLRPRDVMMIKALGEEIENAQLRLARHFLQLYEETRQAAAVDDLADVLQRTSIGAGAGAGAGASAGAGRNGRRHVNRRRK